MDEKGKIYYIKDYRKKGVSTGNKKNLSTIFSERVLEKDMVDIPEWNKRAISRTLAILDEFARANNYKLEVTPSASVHK